MRTEKKETKKSNRLGEICALHIHSPGGSTVELAVASQSHSDLRSLSTSAYHSLVRTAAQKHTAEKNTQYTVY